MRVLRLMRLMRPAPRVVAVVLTALAVTAHGQEQAPGGPVATHTLVAGHGALG